MPVRLCAAGWGNACWSAGSRQPSEVVRLYTLPGSPAMQETAALASSHWAQQLVLKYSALWPHRGTPVQHVDSALVLAGAAVPSGLNTPGTPKGSWCRGLTIAVEAVDLDALHAQDSAYKRPCRPGRIVYSCCTPRAAASSAASQRRLYALARRPRRMPHISAVVRHLSKSHPREAGKQAGQKLPAPPVCFCLVA